MVGAPPHWQPIPLRSIVCQCGELLLGSGLLQTNLYTTQILEAYRQSGGHIDPTALHHSLIARAAVMSAWYPVLYPDPSPERRLKLQRRLDWLEHAAD